MKTSTVIWIIVLVLIVIGVIWWISSGPAPTATTGVATTTSAATTPNGYTLGESTSDTLGNYLVAYNGMTLYEDASDTPGVSTCTGDCATSWPPYTVSSSAGLSAESPVSGTLATLTRSDGTIQVTYNGAPLYFYSGDMAPGDISGTGVSPQWSVAMP